MQVLLTEEEYLKLKNQSEEHQKTYVKRIDVQLSLTNMIKELVEGRGFKFDPITLVPRTDEYKNAIKNFWERIENK